jgi:nicotinate-nucleotide adenylyltransferase
VSERLGPVGILGGTFDPVHIGHLRVALEAGERLGLDHVRLIPLNVPGHRPPPHTPAAQRLAMLRAIERAPVLVDDCEIARGGISYTVDTLAELRRRWPSRSLCLIVGHDAFLSLPGWRRAERLLELAHLVVASRPVSGALAAPGLDELVGSAQSLRVEDLHSHPAGRVYFLDLPLLPIASSDLRARRAAGRDIRHLVPDAVHDFILLHDLYRA